MALPQLFAELADVPWLLTALDLVGVFFFAVSGALLAARKDFDLVGSVALALLADALIVALQCGTLPWARRRVSA